MSDLKNYVQQSLQKELEDCSNKELYQALLSLSLIHISEPTRPY